MNTCITAAEALALPDAQLTEQEREHAAALIAEISAHIKKTMRFEGAKALKDIPYQRASHTVMKVVCLEMMKAPYKWIIEATLMSRPPAFQGAEPIPHHWDIVGIKPMLDVYHEAFSLSSAILH